MTPILIALLVAALVLGGVWYFVLNKPKEPELPPAEPSPPKALKAPKEGSLAAKLDERRNEMTAPKEPEKTAVPEPVAATPKVIETPKEPAGPPASTAPVAAETPASDASAAGSASTGGASEAAKVEVPKVDLVGLTPAPEPARPPPPPRPARVPDVAGMRVGLAKSRATEGFLGRLAALVTGRKEIAPEIATEIEEVLLTSDVGVKTTSRLLEHLREQLGRNELGNSEAVWSALRSEITNTLDIGKPGLVLSTRPTVVMMVGVNGAGKTTTIGKLATRLRTEGRTVVLAAGDTFRAAAVQQLQLWGKKAGCEVVTGKEGADPAAVAFDAVQKAKEIGADVVLIDTAGRLQNKTPLMDELRKVAKTLSKAMDGAPHETLLVLDATTGQNAVQQAALFRETLPLSGIVLTKLDGTAKGGVILGISDELGIPVRYVGLGERAADLHEFVAEEFVEALFGDV